MKIDSISTNRIYTNLIKIQEKPQISYNHTTGSDRVEFSKEAVTYTTALKAAKQAMETTDADRLRKINTIKQQIESGTYNVSGEDIAEKILGR